jgi:hypothetical protein
MHLKKMKKKECLKLEPAIDEKFEQFIINTTDSDDRPSDSQSTSDGEMSGVDPLSS